MLTYLTADVNRKEDRRQMPNLARKPRPLGRFVITLIRPLHLEHFSLWGSSRGVISNALRDRLTCIYFSKQYLGFLGSLCSLYRNSFPSHFSKDTSTVVPIRYQLNMFNDKSTAHGHGQSSDSNAGSTNFTVKAGLAQMLKGGVIMDVVNAEQVNFTRNPTAHSPSMTHNHAGPDSRRGRCLRRYGP